MPRKRKEALQDMEDLVPQLERHLERIGADRDNPSVNHYRAEVLAWAKIERLVSHVGKKTATIWQVRIDAWRSALEE
jgi:hypothetical protein